METPPNETTETAVNLEDSGCIADGQQNGLCDEETAMLDHLEMSELTGSKQSIGGSKSTLKDAGLKNTGKAGMRQVIMMKWDDSPERSKLHILWEKHGTMLVVLCIVIAMLIYSIIAIGVSGFETAKWFFILTMFLWFCLTYSFIGMNCGQDIYCSVVKPLLDLIKGHWYWMKWFCLVCILAALGAFLGLDTAKEPERLISLGGLVFNVAICWLFSAHRRKVKWRPVLWGLALQFIFGLFILRTSVGFYAFKRLGDQVNIFLEYTNVGASFVFGKDYTKHFFAFKVLPVIIFFSSFISVCYYFGIMQVMIKKISWLMQVTMGTSAVESLNAAGNIFVGQTEAPLLVRPFLSHVTMSELHAIMTGGFATIAGGVLAAYIEFGVSASHLLSASVMSAPAALAISKLMYPETEIPESLDGGNLQLPKGEERNFIEAAAKGASTAISLVANIAANLIAFLAFLAFVNAALSWIGSMVGHPEFSFEFICSFLLRPFAFLMGVPWEDCDVVAELLGTKTFLNEFVAYMRLSEYIDNRRLLNGLRTISIRSEIIATYALCGFSNFSSVGIQLGGLGPMAPTRTRDMAAVAMRALFSGTVACLMTACIAGVLYDPSLYEGAGVVPTTAAFNATLLNATLSPSLYEGAGVVPTTAGFNATLLNATLSP